MSVIFYPNDHLNIHTGEFSILSSRVEVMESRNVRERISRVVQKAKDISFLAFPFYLALKKIRWISFGVQQKQHYALGINANLPGLLTSITTMLIILLTLTMDFPKKRSCLSMRLHGMVHQKNSQNRVFPPLAFSMIVEM